MAANNDTLNRLDSPAGGGTGGTNDGTFATPARQDTGNASLATIATNTTGASTSSNQTNGTQQTKITDGTNIANTLKSDGTAAGQNAQLVANTYLPVSFTTTTSQAVGSTDAGNYSWVSIQIVTQGTTSSVAFQESNDNTNWTAKFLTLGNSSGGSAPASSASAAGVTYNGPVSARYFRLNVTGIAGGTTAGVIMFSTLAKPPNVVSAFIQGAVSQSGTWTVQPGNTANTTPWLATINQGGNSASVSASNALKVDGSAVTQPVSGTVTITPSGTQDENIKQVNGIAVNVGTGTAGTGTQRVAVSSDSFPATQAVTGTFFQTTQPVSLATVPQPVLPTAPVNGQTVGTTAGTPVQIASHALTVGVIVQALSTNVTSIFVGISSVSSSTGFELQAGQATSIGVANTNDVWIVSTTNGDAVCWIGS